MKKNVIYHETITPITIWSVILSLVIIASPYIYFNSPKFMISLVIAAAYVMFCATILRTVFGCRRFFEINKLDEARCFILNLGLHPEFDKKTDHSINLCFIET